MVGSGDDGVSDGGWGVRIKTVWVGLGEVETRQWRRCKLDIIDIVGIMLNGVKAFRILRRECLPSSGDGFKVRRAGCVAEGLTHRNEQKGSDDKSFITDNIRVVFALLICTTDVIIKKVDFVIREGDAKIVDGC